jgi:HD-like signal output (HDOD) protein
MTRVIFVDDEKCVLDGLRDLLRKQRKQWDMVFVLGASSALEEFEKAPFDVVVSDMRMPGMDGAALLHEVKRRWPATARIILSGHAEREAVVDVLPVAHQFLGKPCDAEVLQTTIGRACGLQTLLQDQHVRDAVGNIDRLPSAPRTYWELSRAAAVSSTTLNDLAKIVEKDAAMAVKILQVVNSSYFGLARRLSTVQQAVSHLGVELIKALSLTVHVFEAAGKLKGISLDDFQEHSLLDARLAKAMVRDSGSANEAYTAGLVHDIGELVLAMSMGSRFAKVRAEAVSSGRAPDVVEVEWFGVSHAEVGAYLLALWGLPLNIVEAVAYHHHPTAACAGSPEVLLAIHVADALTGNPSGSDGGLDLAFLERTGATADLSRWRSLAEREIATLRGDQ